MEQVLRARIWGVAQVGRGWPADAARWKSGKVSGGGEKKFILLGSFKRSGCPKSANLSFRHHYDIPSGTFFSIVCRKILTSIDKLDPIFVGIINKNDCLMLFRHHANKVNITNVYDERAGPCPARLVGKATAFGLNEAEVKREFTWRRFAIASFS
ncbi:hypothetical protein HMH05_16600 [Pseudomonas sp. SbB1]|uniref:hypothetical protein n=1 Tax=Pseudomonas TaxID=286 RepID=UPI00123751B0|nr:MULTISPECIES: hypothetical protein [Pseudomonas]MBP0707530.1 hypothetical protein [Pseudomonas sp. T34]MCK2186969.1 hypothetical protein [Pseudomonas sp. MB04B]MDD2085781.1 hypothetical protein [Pseudomonas putida]MDD2095732.1 hypothetical protein [Pseudomonas putida]NOG89413.1 hypothetical protein [Pseudomonas sp. SbB1]